MKNMKRVVFIIVTLVIAAQQALPQSQPEKFNRFRQEVLSGYSDYFTAADINENGQLILSATDKYLQLPTDAKNKIMDELVKSWNESLIIIKSDTKNELWSWHNESGKAIKLDDWDLSSSMTARSAAMPLSGTARHPWFIYLGGLGQYSSDHNVLAAFNSRIGFYLLKDRWDFAWALSLGASGVDSTTLNFNMSYGLMSKYYFPIKKLRLSPNVGVDLGNRVVSSADFSDSSPYAAALAGVSWFVGNGSLDLEFKIGDQFTTMVGYTFFPGARNIKKKK